jgi:hypothetical protein
MPQRVRKAVLPVAGLGTRFLPATKAMPKEMLTVVDRPLIQYAVEECMAAGIEEFVFVTGRNKSAIEGEPLLEMHADDAAARGITSGSMVRVFNDRGQYHCRAQVSPRARPGVVNGLGVWWRKLGPQGTNVNEVTQQGLTDLGRAPTFYDCRVEVAPA